MNKAFIFDMDGVIVQSESLWKYYEEKFLSDLIGRSSYLKIQDLCFGNSVNEIYKILRRYGLQLSLEDYLCIYDTYAARVYKKAAITNGISVLIDQLIDLKFKLGLVSSSRQNWIQLVLVKFKKKNVFDYVLSLSDTPRLRPKPFPDGYITAMKKLNSQPRTTIILEDSNKGIRSAKSSGAFTICLKENLPINYRVQGADLTVETVQEVIALLGDKTYDWNN